jgi:hypothetical protein
MGMVIMGYVQVRLKYPDVFQPAHKTDSTSLLKTTLILYCSSVFYLVFTTM